MSDILEAINLSSPYSRDGTTNSNMGLLRRAHDEIVRLRAENAELREEAAFLTQYRVELTEKVISLEKKNAALLSMNGKLMKQADRLLMFVRVWDQEYAAATLWPMNMDCACMVRLLPHMNVARAAIDAAWGGE